MSRDTPLVGGLVAVLLTAPTVAARQPTFRAGVDLVTVDASVLDTDGRPIATLTAADFRLEVDGRARAIAAAHFVFQGLTENRSATPSAAHFSSNEGADAGRVKDLPGPKTIVLVSEGMAVDHRSPYAMAVGP